MAHTQLRDRRSNWTRELNSGIDASASAFADRILETMPSDSAVAATIVGETLEADGGTASGPSNDEVRRLVFEELGLELETERDAPAKPIA